MEDLDKMQECGLIPYWKIPEGTLDEEIFASFSGSEEEDLAWDRICRAFPSTRDLTVSWVEDSTS
jgi:hypothetical protein